MIQYLMAITLALSGGVGIGFFIWHEPQCVVTVRAGASGGEISGMTIDATGYDAGLCIYNATGGKNGSLTIRDNTFTSDEPRGAFDAQTRAWLMKHSLPYVDAK